MASTLHDTLIALTTMIGIAVAVSIAFVAAAAVFERGKNRTASAAHAPVAPAQHPTQTDDRELVLR